MACAAAISDVELVLEVLEVDILWPRWVARIGVTRATEACFLAADRQCTELPLLRLPRLVPVVETAMRLDGSHGRSCFVGEGLARRLPLLSVLFVSFFGLSCMCVFECVWDVCLCAGQRRAGGRDDRVWRPR